MIYFWRFLSLFSLLNLINIAAVDGGAGMEIVWVGLIIISSILSFKKPFNYLFSHKWVKRLFWTGLSCFLVIESIIIFEGIGFNVPSHSDYLIVLGARVRGETPSLVLKERLNVAYDYLMQNPNTTAILTGGQGIGEDISEAEAMKRYLEEKGITSNRLLLEDQATDTVENLTYSFKMIDSSITHPKVIVVTSRFHILRSKMIANELDWKVDGIGSGTLPFLVPTYYLRECFAVIAEFIF